MRASTLVLFGLCVAVPFTGCSKKKTVVVREEVQVPAGPSVSVVGVAPAFGPATGGTTITITGANFAAGAAVGVGGAAATSVTFVSSTSLTAVTPAGTVGPQSVLVTNPNGQSGTLASAFTYLGTAPTLATISPTSGPIAGGTAVTLTGTGFLAGAAVAIGGATATSVTVISSTQIAAVTGAGPIGPQSVVVTNVDGQSASLANGYTYMGAAPTLTSVTPTSGPATGGTVASLAGSGFAAGATVTVGGAAATVFSVAPALVVVGTPTGAVGPATVTITNLDGQSASLVSGFTYTTSPPTVSAVSPAAGPLAGGTAVTISGSNFALGATVTVGGTLATSVTVVSATSITAVTPAGPIGPAAVTVTNLDGRSGSAPGAFTYQGGAPTVGTVAPASGPVGGGTTVTVSGTNFAAGTTVTIGGAAATVSSVASTQVVVTTGLGPIGPQSVVVTNLDGQSAALANGFNYLGPAPTLTSLSPNSGPSFGGTLVTLTGTNFAAGATVTFAGSLASVLSAAATQLVAVAPTGPVGPATVTLVNVDGQSASITNGFTFFGLPVVLTSVSPSSGPLAGGTAVTLSGSSFAAGATVTFGGTLATSVAVVSGATITAVTPAGPIGLATVTVSNPDGTTSSLSGGFTYMGGTPTISSLSATSGPLAGGTTVTISGTNFAAGAGAYFGGATASVSSVTSTAVVVTTPAGSVGPQDVQVVNLDGQSVTLVGGFTYMGSAPTIASISPATAPAATTTIVTITGTNFYNGATATVGGSVINVINVTSTQVVMATGPGPIGPQTVVVTNLDGQAVSSVGGIVYTGPPPTVGSVSPASGPLAGGTAVTITGTNFAAGATVAIGGTLATSVTVVSATSITAVTPAGAIGPAAVTVTNLDGNAANLPAAFNYLGAAPTLTAVSPASGLPGATVTLTGTNFAAGATVSVGGAAWTVGSLAGTTIVVTVSAATPMGPQTVLVTNTDGQSASVASGFNRLGPAPTITGVAPTSGGMNGGSLVTVTGTNFAAGATVTIGGSSVFVTSLTATQIVGITGSGPIGLASVVVTNVDGQSATLSSIYNYLGGQPTISSVSPSSGPLAGGTFVTITGSNFNGGATVRFGSTAATSVTITFSSVTCLSPAGSIGFSTVSVTNLDGQAGSLSGGFNYLGPALTVTGVSPISGPFGGGTTITIAGTNFFAGAIVTIDVANASVTSVSTSQVVAVTPSLPVGPVNVQVKNLDGQFATLAGGFNALGSAPTLSSVSPSSVPAATTTLVTITGTNFYSGATVTVGGTTVNLVNNVASTQIVVATGPGPVGPQTVVVTNLDGQFASTAGGIVYTGPAPTVGSVSPASGPLAGGTAVTLSGTNFAAGATVTIGGSLATSVVVASATSITAVTPAGAIGPATATVTNLDGNAGSLASAFTHMGTAPTIGSVSPNTSPIGGGAFVTISGGNFAAGATVTINGFPATSVSVVSTTQITCVTPASPAGSHSVRVTNVDGQSVFLPTGITYLGAAPTLTLVSPAVGPTGGGTRVSLTGTDFQSGATVLFGATSGTSVFVLSSTRIDVTTPAQAVGFVNVTVVNPDTQSAQMLGGFEYRVPPSITTTVPPAGTASGGTLITIYGSNFVSGATVAVGTSAATSVTINGTGTEIQAFTPPPSGGLSGPRDVIVRNPDTLTATQVGGFTYVVVFQQDPTIVSVEPGSGPAAGGNTVTLTGTNFTTAAMAVWFGANQSGSVTVLSTTTLTCPAPAGTSGTRVNVAVGTAAGLTTTAVGAYGYDVTGTPPTFAGVTSAVTVSGFAVDLRWAAASDNVAQASKIRYAVYIGAVTGFISTSPPPAFITDAGTTWFTAGGLGPNGTYFFVVRARDEMGNEDTNTTELSATTPAVAGVNWIGTGPLGLARYHHAAALLPSGLVLVAGGNNGGAISSCELHDPATGVWSGTGLLGIARVRYTLTTLESGKVLASGGTTATRVTEIYDPATGTWANTGLLGTARSYHTATLLRDGRVLVAGGLGITAELASAEVYDPVAGTWTATGFMPTAVREQTATLLRDGRVLVTGGYTGATNTASASVWDPTTGLWTATTSMSASRHDHTATLMNDGRVLVAGGFNSVGGALATSEIWDPATSAWVSAGSMNGARAEAAAALHPGGFVVVSGGYSGGVPLATSEVYDPGVGGTAGWVTMGIGSLATARRRHTMTTLPTGRILAVAGDNAGPITSCELFDAILPLWSGTGSLATARTAGASVLLRSGRLLAIGGYPGYISACELYDPATGTWTAAGSAISGRRARTATALADGRVLVVAGLTSATSYVSSAELYDPATDTWTTTGSLATGRADHTATLLFDGRVLVAGGETPGPSTTATCELFDPSTGTWSATGSLPASRREHTATLLSDGRILVVGGFNSGGTLTNAALYNPATGTWSSTGSLAAARGTHAATLLTDGKVLVVGGFDVSSLASCEVWDPATGTWVSTGALGTARHYLATATLPSGRVLAAGCQNTTGPLASAEVYEPATGTWTSVPSLSSSRSAPMLAAIPDGRILIAGGYNGVSHQATGELFDEGRGFASASRPVIGSVQGSGAFPATLSYSSTVTVSGSRLRGLSEGSSGAMQASGGDVPIVELTGPVAGGKGHQDGSASRRMAAPAQGFAAGTSVTFITPPAGAIPKGYYLLRVTVNGIPSEARAVRFP